MRGARNWGKLLLEQEASGLSIREYCKRRGISPSGLYQYTSRRSESKEPEARFIEAVVSARESLLEIQGSKCSVKVPTHLSSVELTRIIRAVSEALCWYP